MVQRPNDAAVKDAKVLLKGEESALSMEQYRQGNDAAARGAQIKLSKAEYVGDTVHITSITKNLLLLLHRVLDLNLIRLL